MTQRLRRSRTRRLPRPSPSRVSANNPSARIAASQRDRPMVSRARRLRRARLTIGLSRWLAAILALGLLALTRLGLGLGRRRVLDLLSLCVMAQARDSELLVLLAALDPAFLKRLLGGRARGRHTPNGVELLAHRPEVGGQPVEQDADGEGDAREY